MSCFRIHRTHGVGRIHGVPKLGDIMQKEQPVKGHVEALGILCNIS